MLSNEVGLKRGVNANKAAAQDPLSINDANIRRASQRGILVSFAAQALRISVQFTYQVAIARLLIPEDFGLVAMIAPVVAFAQLLADLGLTQATIQRKNLTSEQINFLFWANMSVSVILAVLLYVAAPGVAVFYKDDRLTAVVRAYCAFFVIVGFYSQHLALLARSLRFGTLAAIDILSITVAALLSVICAECHGGYWALVVFQPAQAAVTLCAALWATRWLPRLTVGAGDRKALVRFGGDMTAYSAANFLSRNLDNVLIGKYLGAIQLALYDRAYKLLLLPITQVSGPISRVTVPVLARLQGESSQYRKVYIEALQLALLITQPAIIFTTIFSREVVVALLGAKWAAAAPIFAVLNWGASAAVVGNSTGWLFISQGRTRQMRRLGIYAAFAYVLAFILGLHWGAIGVAACYSIVANIICLPLIIGATHIGPVKSADIFGAVMPLGFAGAVSFAVDVAARQLGAETPMAMLVLAMMTYVSFFVVFGLSKPGRVAFSEARNSAVNYLRRSR